MFLENFSSVEDIVNAYEGSAEEDLKGANVILAFYGYGNYSGSSFVLYEKDGMLYEVNGSHCSCSGLEGQWEPEETTWAALKMRQYYSFDSEYEGGPQAKEEFDKIIAARGV